MGIKNTPISKWVKIFFSGSKRGGEKHRKNYPHIIASLKKYGEVMTEFMGESDSEFATKDLSSEDTYMQDARLLETADIVFAEVSIPSLGVGYEIAYAESHKKPIICLCMKDSFGSLSSMIKGNGRLKTIVYENLNELDESIKKEIQSL